MEEEIQDVLDKLLECRCKDRYSIEPHGTGHAIYYGRCDHRHGYNLGLLTETTGRDDLFKFFEDALNEKMERSKL